MNAFLPRIVLLFFLFVWSKGSFCALDGDNFNTPGPHFSMAVPGLLVKNLGQSEAAVKYLLKQPQSNVLICDDKLIYQFIADNPEVMDDMPGYENSPGKLTNVHVGYVGCNKNIAFSEAQQEQAYTNFFIGSDSADWHTGIPVLADITAKDLYPGIDIKYYAGKSEFKSDFILHPGASLSDLKLRYDGIQKLEVSEAGELMIFLNDGIIREHIPKAYQVIGHEIRLVEVRYRILDRNTVGFEADAYDPSVELVIDPVLLFSTFLGGSGAEPWTGPSVLRDAAGYLYITGSTGSSNFPTMPGSYDLSYNGGSYDVFILKMTPNGSALVFATFLGGNDVDFVGMIALEPVTNNIVIAGMSASSGFPVTAGAYQTTNAGGQYDVFCTKLNNSGNALIFSTFIGGTAGEQGTSMTLDALSNIWICGYCPTDFPVTAGAYQTVAMGGFDVFACKLNPTGSALLYSTYLGGTADDRANGIKVDNNGNVYLKGMTAGDFPVVAGSYDISYNGGANDLFMAKLNPVTNTLVYSTYLGGPGDDWSDQRLFMTAANELLVTGRTASGFPTSPGVYDPTFNGGTDGFFTMLNSTGTGLVFSTYLGGVGNDQCNEAIVTTNGDVVVTGYGGSGFPVSSCAYDQTFNGGNDDVFLSVFNSSCSILKYSSYIGGSSTERGCSVCQDGDSVIVYGMTSSANFPTTAGCFDPTFNGGSDFFVLKINPAAGIAPVADFVAADSVCLGQPVSFVNNSTAGAGVSWDFGDFSGSTLLDPNHLYAAGGTYLVSLVASTACGSDTATHPVVVFDLPSDIGNNMPGVWIFQDSLCPGDSARINVLNPENSITYQMLESVTLLPVGSPVTANNVSNLQLSTLPAVLPLSVKILATHSITGCSIVLDTLLTFFGHIPVISSQSLAICPGDSVWLRDRYLSQTGIYYDTIVSANACDSIFITELTHYAVVKPELGPDTALCFPQTITLSGPGGFPAYLWSTGSGQSSIVVSLTGDYWLRLEDANGCKTFDTIHVTITQLPLLNLGIDTIVCMGVAVSLDPGPGFNTYLWSTGSTAQILDVSQSGNYGVTVSNSGNCEGSDTITVIFEPGNITNLPADTGSCQGDTILLAVLNPGLAYAWNTGANTSSIAVTNPGLYIVTVTDQTGCQSPDSTVVSMYPILSISVVPASATICMDSSLVLTASGADTYLWTPASGLSTSSGPSVIASPAMTTTYQVSGTAAGACPGDTTVSVVVVPGPTSSLADSTLVCAGYTVTLDPGPCDLCSYTWSNGSQQPEIVVSEPGIYWVTIANSGCAIEDAITVGDCFEIWIPNVFTPNGDGKNESFHPEGVHIQSFNMLIFNRWGEQLYETDDMEKGWDGTFKGKACSEGVYVYLVTYSGYSTGFALTKGQRCGSVTLFR